MARVKVKFLHDLLKTLKIKENPTLMNIISLIFLKFCDDFFSSDDLFDLFDYKIDDEDLKILHHKRPNSKLLTKLVKIRKIEGDMLYFAVQYNHKLLKRKFYLTILNSQVFGQKPPGVCFSVDVLNKINRKVQEGVVITPETWWTITPESMGTITPITP